MNWEIAATLGALALAAIGFLSRNFDKSLSIREHEEFRDRVKADIAQMRTDYKRETDRLEDRIKVLEATRPTTGELEARLGGMQK